MNKPVFYTTLFYVVMLLFTAHTTATAQENLVPNGSFEQYDSCPNNVTEINRATHWYNGNIATADYFNGCASPISGASVPNNGFGYQNAYDGNAYAGIVIMSTYTREYLKVKLKSPLIERQLYHISLCASVGSDDSYHCGVPKIGFLFTNDSAISNLPIIYSPTTVYAYQTITDTLNWVECQVSFRPDSNYSYLVIGDFSMYNNTSMVPIDTTFCNDSYLYIDSVSIVKAVFHFPEIPNVITPNGDGINDVFRFNTDVFKDFDLLIYNRWGTKIAALNKEHPQWNPKNTISDGVYYYILEATDFDNQKHYKTGFIQVLD